MVAGVSVTLEAVAGAGLGAGWAGVGCTTVAAVLGRFDVLAGAAVGAG
jgi:hypothetical protein